jgi:hypothetical protein
MDETRHWHLVGSIINPDMAGFGICTAGVPPYVKGNIFTRSLHDLQGNHDASDLKHGNTKNKAVKNSI